MALWISNVWGHVVQKCVDHVIFIIFILLINYLMKYVFMKLAEWRGMLIYTYIMGVDA